MLPATRAEFCRVEQIALEGCKDFFHLWAFVREQILWVHGMNYSAVVDFKDN